MLQQNEIDMSPLVQVQSCSSACRLLAEAPSREKPAGLAYGQHCCPVNSLRCACHHST